MRFYGVNHPGVFCLTSPVHSNGGVLLLGADGGKPLQHVSSSEVQGEQLVRRPEKEREAKTGPEDPHRTEGHLLPPPTVGRRRGVTRHQPAGGDMEKYTYPVLYSFDVTNN